MWTLGLTFLLTSALVYMLIMLSWINIAVKITTIVWIRNIIALVAIIGGLLNLRSFIKSNDSGCDVVDKNKRKTIFIAALQGGSYASLAKNRRLAILPWNF